MLEEGKAYHEQGMGVKIEYDEALQEAIAEINRGIEEKETKPSHYPNAGKNDLIQFAIENNVGALEFNIIKYVLRYKNKNGLTDLKKAQEYLNRLIESCK